MPELNKERIHALADLIDNTQHSELRNVDTEGFDMNDWRHPCGTPSCLAGFAAWEAQGRPAVLVDSYEAGHSIPEQAAEYLGLEPFNHEVPDPYAIVDGIFRTYATTNYDSNAYKLFCPSVLNRDGQHVRSFDLSTHEAATVLRNLADGGEVDWQSVYDKRNETPAILGDSFGDPGSV